MNQPRLTLNGVEYVLMWDVDSLRSACEGCVGREGSGTNDLCPALNNLSVRQGLGRCSNGNGHRYLRVEDAIAEALSK